ncbi:MAG: DUF58 domain-containing protein [Planctomycetota bacterium]|nr:MAG: DUF58 domain-containing protein [Planctomycetota bacterium]
MGGRAVDGALAAARAQALRYRLVVPEIPLRGALGERAGFGTGSSLELEDLRDYVPGDDPRLLDWRAYARTDRLQTRLYRAGGDRLPPGAPLPEPAGPDPAHLAPLCTLRPRSIRVVVSDLLFLREPAREIGPLAHDAARLVLLQLLDPWERAPESEGAVELLDPETGQRLALQLDSAACRRYRERLARHLESWERAARAAAAIFCPVTAAEPAAMFAGPLLHHRVIEPLPC